MLDYICQSNWNDGAELLLFLKKYSDSNVTQEVTVTCEGVD